MRFQLPDLPSGIRSLTDPEGVRLKQQYPDLWSDPSKTCLTCSFQVTGTKTFKTRVQGAIVEYDCNCLAQWRLHRWLLNAGIGTRYQRMAWRDAAGVDKSAIEAALVYEDQAVVNVSQGRGLTFWSPDRGTGKTLTLALLIKTLLASGTDAYFIQFNEMLDAFSAGWRNEDERAWFVRRIRNAGVLGVDDMGREYAGRKGVAEAMFDTVVRARVASSRPTLITTNYTPEEMLQGYGTNILSLLSEVNDNIEVPGIDYRPKVRDKAHQDGLDGVVYPLVVN